MEVQLEGFQFLPIAVLKNGGGADHLELRVQGRRT
jgi:hypothetical protein